MVTQYQRGADFERRVKKDMEAHGYLALRTPGSKSPTDVHCFTRAHDAVFIQCKTGGSLGPDEWNKFVDYCEEWDATPVMAEKATRGIKYHRITGRKDGSKKRQPMVDWEPEGRADGQETE